MKYRPDIDGLRALAVSAVIFYHAGLTVFGVKISGGFIGVDIFFVISGYLITKIILTELNQGLFSFSRFYLRRARRILPALLFILSVTILYAWFYLSPQDLADLAGSSLAALFFVSNIWFYLEDSYHAAESALKPLLHTWSLGVEEQFYLLFPALLFLAYKLRPAMLGYLIVGLLLISLAIAQFLGGSHTDFNFYLLPSRLWELLAGGAVAYLHVYRPGSPNHRHADLWVIVAVCLLLTAVITFEPGWHHPSVITLWPVLACAIVLHFGTHSKIAFTVLGNRFLSSIGKISYSAYLWHFPVFSFALRKHGQPELPADEQLEGVAITLLLSAFTYLLIEQPFRNPTRVKTRFFIPISVFFLAMISVVSYAIISKDGYSDRLGDIASIFEGSSRNDSFLMKNGSRCNTNIHSGVLCQFNEDRSPILVNLGDSHANMISRPLLELSERKNWSFINMVLSHCPFIDGAERHTGFKATCTNEKMQQAKNILHALPPSIIIYTARFPYYLNSEPYDNLEGGKENSLYFPFRRARGVRDSVPTLFAQTITELAELGHTVILVDPVPEVGWHLPNHIKAILDKVADRPVGRKRREFERLSVTTSYDIYKARAAKSKQMFDLVSHEKVIRVSPEQLFCSNSTGRCRTHNSEHLFYYDDDHLSLHGGRMLVDLIEKSLDAVSVD